MEDLEARLRKARGTPVNENAGSARSSAISMAARLGTEMVAGVVVGVLIGWSFDKWFGTSPWLLVFFFCLGSAAGILNVKRTAERLNAEATQGEDGSAPDAPQETEGEER